MKTKILLILVTVVIQQVVYAQATKIDWSSNPVIHSINDEYKNESAVILADERITEYIADDKGLVIESTQRKLIKAIDDKGVEMYNKMYLPFNPNSIVLELKVRVITTSGKVINLPNNKIFEVEEEGRMYKKFALEGVEKGSEIEYVYKVKKGASLFGLEIYQSSSTPFQKATFTLIVPEYLEFTFKGYNGFITQKDTVFDKKRISYAYCNNIQASPEEKYGNNDAYLKNVQFKFSYNLTKNRGVRQFTWNELAKNIYSNYTTYTEKEEKAVANFLKQLNIKNTASEEEKIVAVEDFVKSAINADKNAQGEDAEKVEKIVKTKVANNDGNNKLFIMCFNQLGINWQLVYPSKRDELPLDESLENYRLIEEALFYFPSTGKFLEPGNASFRYPYITPNWAGTKGLFLEGTTIGNFKTAIAKFDNIYIQPTKESSHNMDVTLRFNNNLDSLQLHCKQIFTGYGAIGYRPAYHFLPKDKIDDFSKDIIKSVTKSDNISNIKVENAAITDGFANKPLNIEADITTAELVEVAGNKILVKLGEIIGPQAEMYQEKPRQLPISIQYPHVLDRNIVFHIPNGYTVKNLNDLVINVTDKQTGTETMGFVSSYTVNGNILNVIVHEFYDKTDYPITMFEAFKNVINAAADFNKVILVLEKK